MSWPRRLTAAAIPGVCIGAVAVLAAVAPPPVDRHVWAEPDRPPAEVRVTDDQPDGQHEPEHGVDGGTLPDALPFASRVARGGGSRPGGVVAGVPQVVFAAYQRAAANTAKAQPGCRLPVSLLAAIGRVESAHARGGRVDTDGRTLSPILGPRLDGGPGRAAITDTDGGRLDGDMRWDRAVGPMQFIPGTWQRWATDGNDDGAADPHNVFDAAAAAGRYLCANGRNLATADGLRSAILSYNRSSDYLRMVLEWMAVYQHGEYVVVPADPRERHGAATLARDEAQAPRRNQTESTRTERAEPTTTTAPAEPPDRDHAQDDPAPSESPVTPPDLPIEDLISRTLADVECTTEQLAEDLLGLIAVIMGECR